MRAQCVCFEIGSIIRCLKLEAKISTLVTLSEGVRTAFLIKSGREEESC